MRVKAKYSPLKIKDLRKRWLKFGLGAIDIIRKRTTIYNRDVNGSPFAPYTKKYEEYKMRKRPGFTGVDLQLTGKMMAELKVKHYSDTNVEIGFSGVNAVKAKYNDKRRHFFGINHKELKKLIKLVFSKIL